VEHFGHLTQSPSGISFFFCLAEESFGFLRKVVLLGGGGVTAGSTLSTPRDFLEKDVVAIFLLTAGFYFKTAKRLVRASYWNAPGSKFTGTLQFSATTSSSIVMKAIILLQNSAGNCPNVDNGGTVLHQELSTRAGGCSGGQDIIDKDNSSTVELFRAAVGEGAFDVFSPLGAGQPRLSGGRLNAAKQTGMCRNTGGAAKLPGESQ
jgi:hypothetical protein